jgi:hypothetical protein
VRQLRKVARVDQSSIRRLSKSQVAAPGRAAITEAVALPVALHREVEVATAAEAVARALEEEEAAAVEVREVGVVAVAGTEASTPMLRKATKAMGAWSTRVMMRYDTGVWYIGGWNDGIVWTSSTGSNSGDSSLVNADVF